MNATGYESALRALLANAEDQADDVRLARFLDVQWRYELAEFPERAYLVGEPQPGAGWTDLSPDAVAARHRLLDLRLEVLESIDGQDLAREDCLNHELALRAARSATEGRRFPSHLMPLNQIDGPQHAAPMSLRDMPTFTTGDLEAVVHRLALLPAHLDQARVLLEHGLAAGVTPPRVCLADVPRQVEALMPVRPADSPLLAPLAGRGTSPGLPAVDRQRARAQAEAVVVDEVYPALRRLHGFLVETYLPGARETVGLRDLPDGEAWYAWAVADVTAGDLGPVGVHALGQAEVERLTAELEAVVADVDFDGTLPELFAWAQTDARFFVPSAGELVTRYRELCKRVDPELPRLFAVLPRLPYGVSPMPDHASASAPAAYYLPGSGRTGRPGVFWVNTYDLPSRPTWEMVPLALHEAVPGHHLQIALADELEGIPPFRRHAYEWAYVEGWGLYAESLGRELGLYDDPWARFGSLVFEIWRAARLVVDTGIHALGWTRDQAVDFFAQRTGKPGHDVEVEIDRYIVWPAQALAYTVGALAIKRLRADAETALGSSFDLRAFHHRVLAEGPLPLDVLAREVRRWITTAGAGR
ncbi:MAG TPA: DUF885 domain-containing protein [Acidimicrobiales bacterium]|nr:DUF885 domain-containing protein [Acidimicrobiales bacterium]